MTSPKDPKAPGPGGVPRASLDQTVMGVAPAMPKPDPLAETQEKAAEPPRAGGGSAIVAAPMISVAGSPPEPAPAAPAAGKGLAGGWQQAPAGARPRLDATLVQGSGAPGAGVARAPTPPHQPAAARPAPHAGAHQPAPRPPAPRPPAPRPPSAAVAPRPQTSFPRPAAHARPPRAPAADPNVGNRTALSADYLKAAREAALAAERAGSPVREPAPPEPAAHSLPSVSIEIPTGPETVPPPTAPPATAPPATAPPGSLPGADEGFAAAPAATAGSLSMDDGPRSFGTQASVAPPPTSEPAPQPSPAGQTPTSAPPTTAPPAGAAAQAPMQVAPAGMAASPGAPRSLQGTMLEPMAASQLPPAASRPSTGVETHFDRVPSARTPQSDPTPRRGSLDDSLAGRGGRGGSGRLDDSLAGNASAMAGGGSLDDTGGWNPQPPESAPRLHAAGDKRGKQESSTPRLIALAAVTLGALAFAFGGELFGFGNQPKKRAPVAARPAAAPASTPAAGPSSQTTLANRPAQAAPAVPPGTTPPGTANPSLVATASETPPPTASSPAILPPGAQAGGQPAPGSAPPVVPAEAAAEAPPTAEPIGTDAEFEALVARALAKKKKRRRARLTSEEKAALKRFEAEKLASPESRGAARAARHAVAGRYEEALPLYEELARQYPQTTAYAAAARVLRSKLGQTPSPTTGATP